MAIYRPISGKLTFDLFCVALGSELLGLGFYAGCVSVAVWVRWALTWVMPPRTIIYYLPKTFKTFFQGFADWVIVLGRAFGDSCLPHGERLHFV